MQQSTERGVDHSQVFKACLRQQTAREFASWSVRKKTRRSPARNLSKGNSREELSPSDSEDVTSGLMEAVLSVSNTAVKDNDSGLGGSASDVLVFGTEVPALTSISKSEEGVEDAPTTSWEDMSKIGSNLLLYKAAERPGTIAVMLEALANGADPTRGSLAACEFLLLNGAKLDRKDRQGRTPLHHASILGNTGQVCQFLKRGAAKDVKDVDGKDPLTIAVEAANADIVTLLRLSKLNDEMRESDGYGNPGDDTFTDVFRDFSNMASNCPEKLKEEDRCLRLLTVDAV
ncbi:hypothetical protein BaRGS_00026148 [Batillaria attramentaria]|uniref:Uncharacterized protein n=1 Tax=Batillaria attramentaria TaxID=370345 RepID=A0ABD0K5U5_9CAEN